MKKILFLIHDLGHGGAEKVLVNLVNNMDPKQFDITVMSLFGGGVNEQFLKEHIRYITVFKKEFRGNSHYFKLFSPKTLHKRYIKEQYDIEVSYLEGPSARIISGCPNPNTKLVSWIHCTMSNEKDISLGFRNFNEAKEGYNKFHRNIFVSESTKNSFLNACPLKGESLVLYNVNPTDEIITKSTEAIPDGIFNENAVKLCATGKLVPIKGFERLIDITKKLIDNGLSVATYILGEGSERPKLEEMIAVNNLQDSVSLLGYQTNPYKYVAKCDLFVCSSYSEGFSTAATEALIVGTPVCTVEVSGMKEMLGENNEYGIVTENNEDALYEGIKTLIENPTLLADYKSKASLRAQKFSTTETVTAVQNMLNSL